MDKHTRRYNCAVFILEYTITTPLSPVFFHDDLISEIYSVLPVKTIMRFRCVSKSCNVCGSNDEYEMDCGAIPYSIHSLIDNPTMTLDVDPYYMVKDKEYSRILGSCNGLICLGGDYLNHFIKA